jgi:hypothetical protein
MRQLIRSELAKAYGADFFRATLPDGSNIVKRKLGVELMVAEFGDAITILLHSNLYRHFGPPSGVDHRPEFRYRVLSRIRGKAQTLAPSAATS